MIDYSKIDSKLTRVRDTLVEAVQAIDYLYEKDEQNTEEKQGEPTVHGITEDLVDKINHATEAFQADIVTVIDLPEEEKQAEGEPVPQHSDWRHANNEFHALLKDLDIEVKSDFILGFLWENYHVEKKTRLTPDQYLDLVKKFRKFSDFSDIQKVEAMERYSNYWINELRRRDMARQRVMEIERDREDKNYDKKHSDGIASSNSSISVYSGTTSTKSSGQVDTKQRENTNSSEGIQEDLRGSGGHL